MKAHMRTFPFGPSLQTIAKTKYNCPVLDTNL
jgi:hypothetical protein